MDTDRITQVNFTQVELPKEFIQGWGMSGPRAL